MTIEEKFQRLATDSAPGQEGLQQAGPLDALMIGDPLPGHPVDFSHGDVDAHPPTPGSLALFTRGYEAGGEQAYTEYRGAAGIRDLLAPRLASFTGAPVDAQSGLILTPGTQAALFLAMASTVSQGDRVAIVRPDYFANRKIVDFLGGEAVPVALGCEDGTGLDLDQLEDAFRSGVRVFLFSNPNNPTGAVLPPDQILAIAELAGRYGVTVIVDELYARLLYPGTTYGHLRAHLPEDAPVITISGPSKTESLSGFRLGVAFGQPGLIERMERLQAIVSLRAPGYSQAVLRGWLDEPEGWLTARIMAHQEIRDDLLAVLRAVPGISARTPQAGSYLFPRLPALRMASGDFIRLLRHQAGVTVTPGTEFSPDADDSIRLNFSQDHETAVEAIRRLAAMVERYRA